MTIMSGLGIVLSLVFGCLLLALVAELYYLLWWKKQRIVNSNPSNRMQEDYSNHAKEMFYLFCWDKPGTVINSNPISNNNIAANPETNHNDPDIEMGFDARKDLLLKALGEEGVDSDIMKLAGHPRFLFTIKEETKEDLESDDGKSKADKSRKGSRTKSLSDLIMAIETQTPYLSPMASPNNLKNSSKLSSNNYNNPLFESSVEADIYRLKSSPPPKFKFLRDAEEKLYRKLVDEAQKSGILNEVILENLHHEVEKDESMMKFTDFNGGKNKEKEWENHVSSQVLPLASSLTSEPFSISSVDSKQPCLH
ncbi:Phosphatidylinositol phosphatase PTPRQ [Bienertia sinuspersici]